LSQGREPARRPLNWRITPVSRGTEQPLPANLEQDQSHRVPVSVVQGRRALHPSDEVLSEGAPV
jgi:hypothetical protein